MPPRDCVRRIRKLYNSHGYSPYLWFICEFFFLANYVLWNLDSLILHWNQRKKLLAEYQQKSALIFFLFLFIFFFFQYKKERNLFVKEIMNKQWDFSRINCFGITNIIWYEPSDKTFENLFKKKRHREQFYFTLFVWFL